jgi:hypothetical protein
MQKKRQLSVTAKATQMMAIVFRAKTIQDNLGAMLAVDLEAAEEHHIDRGLLQSP